jgi:hypothetical protein
MSYDNTNKGTLGKNKNPKSEKSPEYSGQLNVDGKLYWLAGWVKENKSTGEKFFSLAVTAKEEQSKQPEQTKDFSDPIPF